MKRFFTALGSLAVLYLLFVAALLAYEARGLVEEPLTQQRRIERLSEVLPQLEQAQRRAAAEVANARKEAHGASIGVLQQQLATAKWELDDRTAARKRNAEAYLVRSHFNPAYVRSDGVWALKVEASRRKVAGLEVVLSAATGRLVLNGDLAIARRQADAAKKGCLAASARVADFDRGIWVRREWANLSGQGRAKLVTAQTIACGHHQGWQETLRKLTNAHAATQSASADVRAWALREMPDVAAELRQTIAREQQAVDGSVVGKVQASWKEHRMNAILLSAFGLLVASMLTPYLVRTLFYYVLAPIAQRRGAIRLQPPSGSTLAMEPCVGSAVSTQVRIGADEELLIRQGFLQTSSVGGTKRTIALLDVRHPLMSWLTGLVGLTCIRGEDQMTTVSAIADPFAEVAEVRVPTGSALVLLPRALVAVVQPIGRPIRITSHWRLFSLDAWLTGQLRYFAFHGEARLIIRGGRGVRVERAELGRIFAQDQLVGFSADLSYSVTRTETFFPYLFGRECLFKDRVDGGRGVLIVEEAPLALRGGPRTRRGLEGAFDAARKAVGF